MGLQTYLAQDRLRAILSGEVLPDRTHGAALFADISGFTSLTETLTAQLGARRGEEELSRQINLVYDTLITVIEQHGGSVLNFAGDAITCWFDEHDKRFPPETGAGVRAAAAAAGLQRAMLLFPHLGLKVSVASGPVRRFLVGDPAIYLLDALAGETVSRAAGGEHLAQRGEVLVDEATACRPGSDLVIQEWRVDGATGERFAVVSQVLGQVEPAPAPALPLAEAVIDPGLLRPFILPPVFAREIGGQGSFLTEFRPCVVLFVRFTGIDYESGDAQAQLDAFIRQVQVIVGRHEGTLLEMTIGDKGSYAYINFGAFMAHEDNALRAVRTALELRGVSTLQLQMGITQGVLRVGAYGGSTRCSFGALGDDVNLSARLMQTAAPGEILASSAVEKQVNQHFTFEPRPPLMVKGISEPLPIFAVTGERQQRAIRLQEPTYALPMVGRKQEMRLIDEKLDLVLSGQAQVIGIVAEAGLGKSRLVAETIRSARKKGFAGYGGSCQSDGIHTSYLVWKAIWNAFFDVDPSAPLRKQIRHLEGELDDRAPARADALPLLGIVLGMAIPDNDFTAGLDPESRLNALHALLEDCLKSALQEEPMLIVLEDLHWVDALSLDLLEELARALARYPLCFVLAFRPPSQLTSTPFRNQVERLLVLPHYTRIELCELTAAEAEQAIRAKLVQLYPARNDAVPAVLVEKLMARAQGNPFYLEELLNFLRDRGLDPRDPADLEKIELPDSLHNIILSRLDQLLDRERTLLRVASIIGRLFRADWLLGYYPNLGSLTQVRQDLDQLRTLELTALDTTEPELAYLFKHIVTHEVTYENLPYATRARLHEQLARFLEREYRDTPPLEVLAFHYGRSANIPKQREYLRKAGEAAQKHYANEAALAYYGQVLPLLDEAQEQIEVHLARGAVFELMGRYDRAEIDYRIALELASQARPTAAGAAPFAQAVAVAQLALGKLCRLRAEYDPALNWLAQARSSCEAQPNEGVLAQVFIETGMVKWRKGEYAEARSVLNAGLEMARELGDQASMALVLNNLGNMANSQGDYDWARQLYGASLGLRRDIGDRRGIAGSLSNLGVLAKNQGDYAAAHALYEESLALRRAVGDKWGISLSLNCLGTVALSQGDIRAARALQEESLALRREMGDKRGISVSLNCLGTVAMLQGDYHSARALLEESVALQHEIGDHSVMAYALLGLGLAVLAQDFPAGSSPETILKARQHITASLRLRQEMGEQVALTFSLAGMAGLDLHTGCPQRAAQTLGAVDAALRRFKAVMEPEIHHFYEQALTAARDMLTEEAFQAAWAEGQNLSLEQAVQVVEG